MHSLPTSTPQDCSFKQRIKTDFFLRLAFSSHCKFMPLTLNNMLCTPVSDRGGASHLSLNLTTLTMITNVPTPPPLPVPHFLFHSQRYVVFHFKVLRDYSNIHYINNKWNAIELEKSWTPTLAYIPKQTDLDMQKLLL